jgi:DNA-binding transcriptional ArsR family regulator
MIGLDRILHEPARLTIVALLCVVDEADFVFLRNRTGLTGGNLSSHLSKLEDAGYVAVEKQFVGKLPQMRLSLTPQGRSAFSEYREKMRNLLDEAAPSNPS